MRVSKNSNSVNVAGAVAGKLRSGADTTLEAIGVEASHIAITALINATKFLADENMIPVITLSSEPKVIAGAEKQVVVFHVRGEKSNE